MHVKRVMYNEDAIHYVSYIIAYICYLVVIEKRYFQLAF
jgi:hypothetical protein